MNSVCIQNNRIKTNQLGPALKEMASAYTNMASAYKNMASASKKRKTKRFYLKAPILVEDHRTGYHFAATMHNYCDQGLYFESDYALRPERKVRIKVDDPAVVSKLRSREGVVRWRKSLNSNNSSHQYGTGIKYR